MKKFLQISFLAIYVFSILGIHISSHFCGDYLVSVDVNIMLPAESENCCEGAEENDCCKNEDVKIQIVDYQKESKSISFEKTVVYQKNISYSDLHVSEKSSLVTSTYKTIELPQLDIPIKNCSWLI